MGRLFRIRIRHMSLTHACKQELVLHTVGDRQTETDRQRQRDWDRSTHREGTKLKLIWYDIFAKLWIIPFLSCLVTAGLFHDFFGKLLRISLKQEDTCGCFLKTTMDRALPMDTPNIIEGRHLFSYQQVGNVTMWIYVPPLTCKWRLSLSFYLGFPLLWIKGLWG